MAASNPGKRAVFLDKDGTLVRDVPHNVDPARVRFCEGVEESLPRLRQRGFELIIISNQPGVAQGRFDVVALRRLEKFLAASFRKMGAPLAGFYFCPHDPGGTVARFATRCACRKPLPGLLYCAAMEHGINLGRSWFVGDILNDVEAGRRAGCRTVLIDNGNETEWLWSPERTPHYAVRDFREAAQVIAEAETGVLEAVHG